MLKVTGQLLPTMALAVTTDHFIHLLRARVTIGQYPFYSLFKFQAGTRLFWPPVCLSSGCVTLPHMILAVVSIVSFWGGRGAT